MLVLVLELVHLEISILLGLARFAQALLLAVIDSALHHPPGARPAIAAEASPRPSPMFKHSSPQAS